MRFKDLKEDGVIVPGVNTTVDVKPGETERQAAKFFGNGKPKELHKKARKNSTPGVLYNMGLVNESEYKGPLHPTIDVSRDDDELNYCYDCNLISNTIGEIDSDNGESDVVCPKCGSEAYVVASDEEIEKYGLNEGLGKLVSWATKTYGKKVLENPKIATLMKALSKSPPGVPGHAIQNIIDGIVTAGGLAGGAYTAAKVAKGKQPETEEQPTQEGLLSELWGKKSNIKQSDPLKVLDNLAGRNDNTPFPVKMYDNSTINILPSTARRFINIYLQADDDVRKRLKNMMRTKQGFKELLVKLESVGMDDDMLAEAWSEEYKRSIDRSMKENKDKDEELLKGFDARTQKDIISLKAKYPHADNILSALLADVASIEKDSDKTDTDQDKQLDDLESRVEKLEKKQTVRTIKSS